MSARDCPFCGGAAANGGQCAACGRVVTVPRRICRRCGAQTPSAERRCHACGTAQGNELRWKIPLIVTMFVAAFVLAVAAQIYV